MVDDKLSEIGQGSERKVPASKGIPQEVKKEIAKIKEKIEKFSKEVIKKIPYLLSVGLLPALPPTPSKSEIKKPGEKEKRKPKVSLFFQGVCLL